MQFIVQSISRTLYWNSPNSVRTISHELLDGSGSQLQLHCAIFASCSCIAPSSPTGVRTVRWRAAFTCAVGVTLVRHDDAAPVIRMHWRLGYVNQDSISCIPVQQYQLYKGQEHISVFHDHSIAVLCVTWVHFAIHYIGRLPSSGALHHEGLVRFDVSEEYIASIIRVTRIDELETTLAVTNNRSMLHCQHFYQLTDSCHPYDSSETSILTVFTTAICFSIIYIVCEPRHLTTLWASMACYRDSFTFIP
jgi:hypothetical protein